MIFIEFFSTITPFLHLVLYCFYQKIINLSTIYKWSKNVLFLALNLYTHIIQNSLTNLLKLEIFKKKQACICNFFTILKTQELFEISKYKCVAFFILDQRKKDANNNTIFCYFFNKRFLTCLYYYYKYIYKTCKAKD